MGPPLKGRLDQFNPVLTAARGARRWSRWVKLCDGRAKPRGGLGGSFGGGASAVSDSFWRCPRSHERDQAERRLALRADGLDPENPAAPFE